MPCVFNLHHVFELINNRFNEDKKSSMRSKRNKAAFSDTYIQKLLGLIS